MAEFVELRPLPQPRRAAELTPEAAHFKCFKPLWRQKESGRVSDLAFQPGDSNQIAVASGTKIGIWKPDKNGEPTHVGNMSRFKNMTKCMSWRCDGSLLLAGDAAGSCAVLDVATKTSLRRLRGHGDEVTCATFATADKTRCATGSRDGKLRIWDVVTSELLHTVDAHKDCLKVVVPGPGGPDGWITAGYDGKVKLWDLQDVPPNADGTEVKVSAVKSGCVVAVDHGHPVEAGVAFPGGALFLSAGGTEVKLWDMAFGGRLVESLPGAHSKTITAVCLDKNAAMLLTASFDGLAKVFRAATLEHLWTYALPGPATCASWRPDSKAFAVGLDDGQWQVRVWRPHQQKQDAVDPADPKDDFTTAEFPGAFGDIGTSDPKPNVVKIKRALRDGHLRGMLEKPNEDDDVVELERPLKRKKKESQLDYLFRKFEYKKVVEFLSSPSTEAVLGLAAIDELLKRGALENSFTEIGEELCLAVLNWLLKALACGDALHQQLCMEALHTVLDGNKCLQPPCTPQLVTAVTKIEEKMDQELKIQATLMETAGMLKTVTAS